ncbi:ferric reductase-like transmembrane domain-containing protein [Aurantiacibacter gilvus]|uniref:Ferric reductase-like transmembrane domain-containing protein n=1 Tax=Aurantiacibacter gilvus TaxID=3139141 RepID=A0ABU9IDV2_9SPHN
MNKTWPIVLGLLTSVAAMVAGLLTGTDTLEQWQLAARWTARASFPLFLIPFIASALVRLYPTGWTRALMRNRRWWGLGFAAAFGMHLACLLVNQWLRDNFPPTGPGDPGFYLYLLLLAMVLTSTDTARKRMGRWWKVLHRTGMWGFWVVFVISDYLAVIHGEWPAQSPLTDPYFVVGIAAALSKLAAWRRAKRRRGRLS